jgi:hypothetical protein
MFLNSILLAMIFSLSAFAQTWKKVGGIPHPSGNIGSPLTCPENFIFVPKLIGYTYSDFCVAKYEMKQNPSSGAPISVASGTPYVNISRDSSASACRGLGQGYQLISNDQWQTVAKNIASVDSNWSSGTAYVGVLSQGHSDNAPASLLAASTDNDPCSGTGQTCDNVTWNSQRRTLTLTNGEIIWDFAGNASEWVHGINTVSQGANGNISSFNSGDIRQTRFGNNIFCDDPTTSPYCNYGYGTMNATAGAIHRGGRYTETNTGIFTANLGAAGNVTSASVSFRCVYQP